MLPIWIYEPMPYLCMACGAASVLGLDLASGRLSGLLLSAAGIVIFMMRREYRRASLSRRGQR